jgi:hypothetical protein
MANYNTLSRTVAKFPDSLAIFRRFLPQNIRNVLYMQAEIENLSALLEVNIEFCSNSKDSNRRQFEFNVAALKGPHENPADAEQWRLILELRGLLREYGSAALFNLER